MNVDWQRAPPGTDSEFPRDTSGIGMYIIATLCARAARTRSRTCTAVVFYVVGTTFRMKLHPVGQLCVARGRRPRAQLTAPLQVRAFDQYGNGVADASVLWRTSAGRFVSQSSSTSSTGVAQAVLETSSTPQDHVVTATVAGFPAVLTIRGQ